jgi:hypothetical protein
MAEKNIFSKPFIITVQGGDSVLYTETRGRQQGDNFLPKDGDTSTPIKVYVELKKDYYDELLTNPERSALLRIIPPPPGSTRENLYLGEIANIVDGVPSFTPLIAQNEIPVISKNLTTLSIQGSQNAIADSGLVDKSNISPNTAAPQNQPPTSTQVDVPIGQPGVEIKPNQIKTYPINMAPTQDRMEFTVWKYKNRSIQNASVGSIGEPEFERIDAGFVYLPVTKISDTNSVNWNEDGINELQRRLADLSFNAMSNKEEAVNQGEKLLEMAREKNTFGNFVRLYLTGQAVQANSLLTKSTGAILNPNIELLFTGPTLRQFAFGFDLLAKSKPEAKRIKEIIKFFKKNMAIRNDIGGIEGSEGQNLFLNSPYVFRIKYLSGSTGDNENAPDHKSIGKIKMCALQSCTVDYTPMGSYMTFNDPEKTFPMFMYRLNLQFKELTPVYSSDYSDSHDIGF